MTTPLSVQLYTLREEAKSGIKPVIEKLARIGFDGVEAAGFGDMDASAFKNFVESLGMKVSGSHIGLPSMDEAESFLDTQTGLGPTDLIVAFLPPDQFSSEDEAVV